MVDGKEKEGRKGMKVGGKEDEEGKLMKVWSMEK